MGSWQVGEEVKIIFDIFILPLLASMCIIDLDKRKISM